jgi:hypothetical protein
MVLRGHVPQGFNVSNGQPTGVGPWSMDMHFTNASDRFNEIYQVIWTANPSTFDVGANFGNKWGFFLGAPGGSRTNHFWASFDRTPTTTPDVRARFVTQFIGAWSAQGQQFTSASANQMPYGHWYKVEMLMRSGTPGAHDGSFEMWVNGVKYLNIQNIGILPSDATGNLRGFRGVKWNPTWGAVEAQPIDTDMCVARWAVFVAQKLP